MPGMGTGHRQYGGKYIGLGCVQVSCHDNGWLGLPGNHYTIRGSRARFATPALLAPHLPLFFAGEGFDAEPRYCPTCDRTSTARPAPAAGSMATDSTGTNSTSLDTGPWPTTSAPCWVCGVGAVT